MPLTITEDNFDSEVLNSDQPVLVDFWAEWCGPCKMISPMVDAVAAEVDGIAKVGKCNLDDGQSIAAKYGIRSIPTLLFFKDGEVKDQIVGANVTQGQISEKLQAMAKTSIFRLNHKKREAKAGLPFCLIRVDLFYHFFP